jgi:uncharacterized protein YpmS
VLSGAMAVVLAGSAGVLGALALTRAAPTWWRTVLREDPATVSLAQETETWAINLAHDSEKLPLTENPDGVWRSEVWRLELTSAEVNAWLNVRLPKWLANQKDQFRWPAEVSDVQVEFHDDRITLGARVRAGQRHQVLTATLMPRLETDGRLYLPAQSVNIGRLSIPANWVLEPVRANAESYIPSQLRRLPETELFFDAFGGAEPLLQKAMVRLGDGRRIRVLKVEPRNGRIQVFCQTERDPSRATAQND